MVVTKNGNFDKEIGNSFLALRRKQIFVMATTTNNSTALDWILFLVSTVICVFLLIYANEWFWLALPFVLTYLVRAMKAI